MSWWSLMSNDLEEHLTFEEAAVLLNDKASALKRVAVELGLFINLGGRYVTTRSLLKEQQRRCQGVRRGRASTLGAGQGATRSGSSETAKMKSALAAAKATVLELKGRSRST